MMSILIGRICQLICMQCKICLCLSSLAAPPLVEWSGYIVYIDWRPMWPTAVLNEVGTLCLLIEGQCDLQLCWMKWVHCVYWLEANVTYSCVEWSGYIVYIDIGQSDLQLCWMKWVHCVYWLKANVTYSCVGWSGYIVFIDWRPMWPTTVLDEVGTLCILI